MAIAEPARTFQDLLVWRLLAPDFLAFHIPQGYQGEALA
jgi:hypothetical protein